MAVSKNLLSRDFRHRSIFDFCNNIDPNRTSRGWQAYSRFCGRGHSQPVPMC